MENKDLVKAKIETLLKAREEFFAYLDAKVPKKNRTDVFDFTKCDEANLKEIYAKFYPYDYAIRGLLPYLYEAYGMEFNV